MNWYKHYMGDFARDTAHLTILQHGVYRLLLDHYYATEQPLNKDFDSLCRIIRASTTEEKTAISFILNEYFELTDSGYRNTRADKELLKYEAQAETNRRIARERTVQRTVSEPSDGSCTNPDTRYQIPDTILQKPEESVADKPLTKPKFQKPSILEIQTYANEIESSINPVVFYNHYES